MALTTPGPSYAFTFRAVHDKAPTESGVYIIHSARRWLHVGESVDIRESLFAHLNDLPEDIMRAGPLSFSFETATARERTRRRDALVAALQPQEAARPPNHTHRLPNAATTWNLSSQLPRWHTFDGRRSRIAPQWSRDDDGRVVTQPDADRPQRRKGPTPQGR